jgi:hypothetical protein
MDANAKGIVVIDRQRTPIQPSSTVSMRMPSVPHIALGRSVVRVPSCATDAPWGRRYGESNAFSRIRRKTRLRPTRMSRPDLAVSLTGKGRGRQIGPDGGQQIGIRHLRLWAAPRPMKRHDVCRLPSLLGVDRRAGDVEHPADPFKAVGLAGAWGGRPVDARDPQACPVDARRDKDQSG